MLSAEKEYIVLSLDDGLLKLVRMRISASSQKVLGVLRKDIQGIDQSEWMPIIQSSLNEMNIKNASAVFVMPISAATTKNIEIPSLDSSEIKSIIDLQAGRHTPYSREEILISYINIGVYQRNYTQVLLIIVNRNVVKAQLNLLEQSGLKTDKVIFAPEAMARFYAKIANIKNTDPPFGIIDVGKRSTDFIIGFNNTVITCRSIPWGMEHLIKEGKESQDKFLAEIMSSVEAYQHEDVNKLPEVYFLTSDDAKLKELQPILVEKLKAQVKIFPCLDHVKIEQPVLLKLASEFDDDSFLDVISAGVSLHESQVDLLPDEIKLQRTIEEQGRQATKAGILVILLLLLVCGIFLSKLQFRSIYLDKVTEEYHNKQNEVEELEKVANNSRIIRDYLASRMVGLEVVNELYRLVPEEIYLRSIELNDNGQILIEGTSETMSLVFNLVTALEESALFKSVKTESTTATKERGKDVAAFQISFKLESAPDEVAEETDKAVEKNGKSKTTDKQSTPATTKPEEKAN